MTTTLQPDSRGRVALGTLIDRSRTYTVDRHEDGSVVLTPIAHVLTDEQYADLQADPRGFADMLARARTLVAGEGATVPADELFITARRST